MTAAPASSPPIARLEAMFAANRAAGRKALAPFVTAGDPDADATVAILEAIDKAGASLCELGVPYSDPIADGPVIQASYTRALGKGLTLAGMFDAARRASSRTAMPILAMASYSLIFRRGIDRFVADAKTAGVDGVLVVDYPPEECEAFARTLHSHQLDPIFLLAPTSTVQRMKDVGRIASGYVYYVSLKGVTGAGHLDIGAVADMLPRIREHVHVPVGVGFGIRDAASAKAVAAVA